jgi:hypothetical protein
VPRGAARRQGVVDDLYVAFRGQAAASEIAIREALAAPGGSPEPTPTRSASPRTARVGLSKVQKCLPPRLESAFLAEVLTDPGVARAAIASDSPD